MNILEELRPYFAYIDIFTIIYAGIRIHFIEVYSFHWWWFLAGMLVAFWFLTRELSPDNIHSNDGEDTNNKL
jgi:hypothetical protein